MSVERGRIVVVLSLLLGLLASVPCNAQLEFGLRRTFCIRRPPIGESDRDVYETVNVFVVRALLYRVAGYQEHPCEEVCRELCAGDENCLLSSSNGSCECTDGSEPMCPSTSQCVDLDSVDGACVPMISSSSPSGTPTRGSASPSSYPTFQPSPRAMMVPSRAPSFAPTSVPTPSPIVIPTEGPFPESSVFPTSLSTGIPTFVGLTPTPSVLPTWAPSPSPSLLPTRAPVIAQSYQPSYPPVDPQLDCEGICFYSCANAMTDPCGQASGLYEICPEGETGTRTSIYCDQETDGGGWMLLYSYKHNSGENNGLVSDTPPLDPDNGYSHFFVNQVSGYTEDDIQSVRFYCWTSAHERIVHFKNSDPIVRSIAWSASLNINTPFLWTDHSVVLDNHTANLPLVTEHVDTGLDKGYHWFPFWKAGEFHWAIRGADSRWECDDFTADTNQDTLHNVWVRLSTHNPTSSPTVAPTSPTIAPTANPTRQIIPAPQLNKIVSFENATVRVTAPFERKFFAPGVLPCVTCSVTPPYTTSMDLDSTVHFQTMEGFGYALTGGSAGHLMAMDAASRRALLEEFFRTDTLDQVHVSYLRITMGSSDLDSETFSYVDLPEGETDVDLENFSLDRDRIHLIPLLKEILAVKPDLAILATPWSAPTWMKTNGSFVGGSVKPEYFSTYAQYFVKYIQGMKEEGIKIDVVSVQNEPLHDFYNPSMYMSAEDMTTFVGYHLGPAFAEAAIPTKILVFDHNPDHIDYALYILANETAARYVYGSAFHLYAGTADSLTTVQEADPSKAIWFTEQFAASDVNQTEELLWHLEKVVIGATRHWARTVFEWNLSSNPTLTPHTPGGCMNCLGAVTIDNSTIVERNAPYFIIKHISVFVPPGSVRIRSPTDPGEPNVAFATPSGEIVLIIANIQDSTIYYTVRLNGGEEQAQLELPPRSVGTFSWPATFV